MSILRATAPDVILLHAPSVYDFRKEAIVYGPVSDLIPSTPVFEMYPIGFSTMAAYLTSRGKNVRIINLAVRMLQDPKFDVEAFLARLRPKLFGIDLHWLPHCHGSIEIAKIVKKLHPSIPIVFGGFSSTFFHEELILYPEVDFVIRGDSGEKPLLALVEALEASDGGGPGADAVGENISADVSRPADRDRLLKQVPNLTWKDAAGEVRVNFLTYVPLAIDEFEHGYEEMTRSVVKYRDLASVTPFLDWMGYPIMPVMVVRGCNCECVFCGGSHFAFKGTMQREFNAYRSPQALVKDMRSIARISRGPIFLIGDVYQPGERYAEEVLSLLERDPIANTVILEFFFPPPADFSQKVARALPHHSYEMSMETHDFAIRERVGKGYSNEELEDSVDAALRYHAERFDLYYIIGLPGQTPASVEATIEYCDYLYGRFQGDPRLRLFISPLAPFLDPGSRGFMQPEDFGYRLSCRTLEDHRQALLQPSWKYTLNYETDWMTRDELVDVTYRAALDLNRIKLKWGVIPEVEAARTEARILRAVEVMKKVDDIVATASDGEERRRRLLALKAEADGASISTVCDKSELEWRAGRGRVKFHPWRLLKTALGWGSVPRS